MLILYTVYIGKLNCLIIETSTPLSLMLDSINVSDNKEAAKPILYDTCTLIHINQGSLITFLYNLRKLCKSSQCNDSPFNISDIWV